MTRVIFYSKLVDKQATLANLARQALEKRHVMTVLIATEQAACEVSQALWQSEPTQFLPNVLATHAHAAMTPIVIDWQEKTLFQDDILVNLSGQQLTNFSRFKKLIELVGNDEEDKAAARLRFKFYRDCGYDIQHFEQPSLSN